ncbi:MAG TPA: hypothetical protein VGH33_18530 [Isosphaeraceae bacterium]|jgi:hypothetical protein
MELPDFTVEHLKQLPLRAIVAFAARCARRIEPLAQRPEGDPERESRGVAIEAALRMAEDFAGGTGAAPDPSVVEAIDAIAAAPGGSLGSRGAAAAATWAAHAAVSAWHVMGSREAEKEEPPEEKTAEARKFLGALAHVTADLAALDAFTAAVDAYDAIGYRNEEFVAAALNDYDRLLRLKLGRYPEPGEPIDPSPDGPLGRL